MSSEDNLPDIALANVALENLNEKGENKIKTVMSSITDELTKTVSDNYNTLNDKITKDVGDLNKELTTQITDLSDITTEALGTKAGVDLSNLTDAGDTVIDNRITSLMNSNTFGLVVAESGNNFVKFKNGLLIQWISFTTSNTWTYQKPFSKNPSVVIGDSISSNAEWHPTSVTTTLTAAKITRIQAYATSVVAIGY